MTFDWFLAKTLIIHQSFEKKIKRRKRWNKNWRFFSSVTFDFFATVLIVEHYFIECICICKKCYWKKKKLHWFLCCIFFFLVVVKNIANWKAHRRYWQLNSKHDKSIHFRWPGFPPNCLLHPYKKVSKK